MRFKYNPTEREMDIIGLLQGYNGILIATLLMIGGMR